VEIDNFEENSTNFRKVKPIGARNISVIFILGIAGQIAWAVENSWFNTFVYDEMTTDPTPIAWMVAVSAVTATLTTIFIGTLSDQTKLKWGRRKPYLVLGYILWGIITALFPLVAWIQNLGIAIVMVIVMDAVMTFFGSTANDAAFSAWITDISHSSNRNRIQSYNQITGLIANLVALGAAGIIIEQFDYFVFFYGLGGIVSICGLLSQFFIKEKPVAPEEWPEPKTYWKRIVGILSPGLFRNNRILTLLFFNMALGGIAGQISSPYTFIYIEHYLGFPKDMIGVIGGVVILFSTLFLIFVGAYSHRFNRKRIIVVSTILNACFTVIVAFMRSLWSLTFMYTLSMALGLASSSVHAAWMQDKYPEGDVGRFQGIRMIFFVLLPMVIGPPIGSAVIKQFGAEVLGVEGYVPTPEIFIISAIASLFALIPLFFIKKEEGRVKFVD
jgi:MFS family permease